jgi:hypothetical protein
MKNIQEILKKDLEFNLPILKEDLDEVDGLIYDKEADFLSLPKDFEDVKIQIMSF